MIYLVSIHVLDPVFGGEHVLDEEDLGDVAAALGVDVHEVSHVVLWVNKRMFTTVETINNSSRVSKGGIELLTICLSFCSHVKANASISVALSLKSAFYGSFVSSRCPSR